MSERDRQNPYDRNQQYGSGNRTSEGSDSPRQANQWQSDDYRQQGGGWHQDAEARDSTDDYTRDHRLSEQGSGSSRGGYRSSLNDDYLRNDAYGSGRDRDGSRGSYGQHNDRNRPGERGQYREWRGGSQGHQDQQGRYGRQGQYGGRGYGDQEYGRQDRNRQTGGGAAGGWRDFDASGGNDFGSFTSEDYGGRDFYNRGGGLSGGQRSSESYRPSYGVSSWFDRDDDDRSNSHASKGQSGQREYGDWRQYGESRGFLARAGDEIASWFGDEDASRRRDRDRKDDHSGRGPANYKRSDERIQDDVNDHLTHDWGVDASHITVSVKDGEVTLDGTVDSRQAKRRAEDAADRVSGVKHVQNNLRVQDNSSASYGNSGYGQNTAAGSTNQYGGATSQSTSGLGTSGLSSGSATTGTGTSGSSVTGSSASGTSSTTGSASSTTGGIGSTATSGVIGSSGARSSDKSS